MSSFAALSHRQAAEQLRNLWGTGTSSPASGNKCFQEGEKIIIEYEGYVCEEEGERITAAGPPPKKK